ncbi:MAG: DUF2892 domain-containing protein [Flavobacterium sp. JAD_PAG50586_2]|nr:MAG: DUF2892 domain-containing protein [Flavobacterium sp. JAD_PAG50586_2]
MQSNLGILDKSIRITVALTTMAIYPINIIESNANYMFLATGALLLFTVLTGYCPLYTIWNFSTKDHQEK